MADWWRSQNSYDPSAMDGGLEPDWDLPEVDPRFEQLSAYLDGELPGSEARLVETWLTEDPRLQQIYVQLSGIQAGFDRLPRPSAANVNQLAAQVFERVKLLDPSGAAHVRPAVKPCPQSWPRLPMVAAVLALLSGAGLVLWRQPQPMISLEHPPVEIARIPESTLLAERYLLKPETHQDPYAILFALEAN